MVPSVRRATRRDPHESAIVDALRRAGCTVSSWGADGAPDLVVGHHGRTYLLEVKSPAGPRGGKSQNGQTLTSAQQKWHRDWRGHVAIVTSIDEALRAVGVPFAGLH